MSTALLSVYNKQGIADFAKELMELDFDIFASEGTGIKLIEAHIPVSLIDGLAQGRPILGHRVVTLSRGIHAGLLARPINEDQTELAIEGLPRIDLVCVDFYPVLEEIKKPGSTRDSVIEMTDVGGPAMICSAAKGRRIVICDADDREKVIHWIKSGKPEEDYFIQKLVAKAYKMVADYYSALAEYHGAQTEMFGRSSFQSQQAG